MQCNKSHFGKPYQDTLTRLLGNSKKTKTNSLWIVLNYAMWNSLISIIDIWFRIRFPWFRFWIPYFSATMIFWNHFFAVHTKTQKWLKTQPRCGSALSLTKRVAASENEIAQKGLPGTPGDEVVFDIGSMRIHCYLQYSDSFSPPEPLGSIFTIL